jgi:outer membrane protein OmpA-like peptidoglycan-associated protein
MHRLPRAASFAGAMLWAWAPAPLPAMLSSCGEEPPPPGAERPVTTYDPFFLFFDWNSTAVTPANAQLVDNIVTAEAQTPGCVVLIVGHADASGPSDYNAALAARRAKHVARVLRRRGVRSQIRTESFGEDRQLLHTADGVPAMENRRVEVGFLPPWRVDEILKP